jgi:DNA-binding SARP family transcriptional activator
MDTPPVSSAPRARVQPRPRLRVHLFGSIRVEDGERALGVRDFGGVKPKQILEILLVARGRSVPKDRLADMLWGESLPRNVAGALDTYVSLVRGRLGGRGDPRRGHRLIVTEPEAYRFRAEEINLDLDGMDELVRRADAASGAERRRLLEAAAELAAEDVLADEPYADWAEPIRDLYRSQALRVRVTAARAGLADADPAAAARHADAGIAIDPLDAEAVELAMLARHAAGRAHEAARVFARYRDAAGNVGIAPAADVVRLASSMAGDRGGRLLPRFAAGGDDDVAIARLATLGAVAVALLAELDGLAPGVALAELVDEVRRGGWLQGALSGVADGLGAGRSDGGGRATTA